jgi:hypothetical protein
MARLLFEKQAVRGRSGTLVSGTTFVVYTDASGTVLADISASSGGGSIAGSVVTTADIAGLGPAALRFYGPPDGTDTLWLRSTVDATLGLQKVEADTDDRLDTVEPRMLVLINEGPRNPMSAEWADGAAGDGVTDDTDAFNALLDSFGSRGGEIEVPPRVFRIPGGITEAVHGLSVRGLGQRILTPRSPQDEVGAVIKSETAGAWCWTHDNPDKATTNEYRGARFENLTFEGDADTDGGLRLLTNSNTVRNCTFLTHPTGTGFLVGPEGPDADDASWNHIESCIALDCLTGFDIGGGGDPPSSGSEIIGCITLKTFIGGIQDTGSGFVIRSNNVTVLGGKTEREDIGWNVVASDAVMLIGCRAEGNNTGFLLNRDSGIVFGSRIRCIGCVASSSNDVSFQIGANQLYDMLLGCSMVSAPVDNGTGTVIWGSTQNDMVLANTLQLRRQSTGQAALSLGIGATVKGNLLVQTSGVDLDVSGVTSGSHAVKLGATDATAYFGVQDSAGNLVNRVFANGDVSVRKAGDSVDRVRVNGQTGELVWSSGSATADTNLYRSAADVLKTDDRIVAALGVQALPMTAPSAPASGAIAYVDSADSKVKVVKADGTIIVLG